MLIIQPISQVLCLQWHYLMQYVSYMLCPWLISITFWKAPFPYQHVMNIHNCTLSQELKKFTWQQIQLSDVISYIQSIKAAYVPFDLVLYLTCYDSFQHCLYARRNMYYCMLISDDSTDWSSQVDRQSSKDNIDNSPQ